MVPGSQHFGGVLPCGSQPPKFVKAIKGKKTDKKDAQWIADLFKHDLVRGSFIPPKDIRQLRDLCRYWVKLSSYMTGEKNRAQNCLTVSNFKLDDVFSNVFGKSASAITTQLLEHPGEQFDVAPFVDGAVKHPLHRFRKQLTVSSLMSRRRSSKSFVATWILWKDIRQNSNPYSGDWLKTIFRRLNCC